MNQASLSSLPVQVVQTETFEVSEGLIADGELNYYIEKIKVFYIILLCVLIYSIIVNGVLIYESNDIFFKHHLAPNTIINLILLSAGLTVILTLYYLMIKRRASSIGKRVLLTSKIIFQVIACIALPMFYSTFTSAKNLMSRFYQFQWDETFADLDTYLHGGLDPWVLYFPAVTTFGLTAIDFFYYDIWIFASALLPILVVLFERNQALLIRFFFTYAVVWLGLGNLFASAFLSAGPPFYGFVAGDAGRFADLFVALNALGFQETITLINQDALWKNYVAGAAFFGSGISAFPSVHVGMAMLVGLYLWRRLGQFGVLALLFPLAIQVFSVVLGWHYAVDGYFSIIVITLVWHLTGRWLRRRESGLPVYA